LPATTPTRSYVPRKVLTVKFEMLELRLDGRAALVTTPVAEWRYPGRRQGTGWANQHFPTVAAVLSRGWEPCGLSGTSPAAYLFRREYDATRSPDG